MKRAEIYVRSSRCFLAASSQTIAGVWILKPPYLVMDASRTDGELGLALLDALSASQTGIAHPDPRGDNIVAPFLKAAGVKSWKSFVATATCINVELEGESVTMIPTRRVVGSHGLEEERSSAVVMNSSDPGWLGSALRTMIASRT
jgi:hypothetical protein